ncbi:MAG: purine-nucleoside phosphorylase [Planctomycetia bacterium]|jgi:purine-nucleoside phosphorylase|nr:purine-nucleoside phosphorylase [Planctomycetia bacterium]
MLDQHDKISEACAAIAAQWPHKPAVGIILGSGLGGVTAALTDKVTIPYESIPHFAKSTAHGHAGQLVCGLFDGVPVVVMEGRMHAYEGYPLAQITFPVRVVRRLGAELLVVTNACGGLNPQFRTGDLMVIDDHINLMNDNPLVGINDDRLGPRFPDMSAPYTPILIDQALAVARKENFVAHRGVYVAVTGPNLETRAEYRFLRVIGADVVGMSTVPEVIVAVHAGMKVLGISVITDMCLPDALEVATVEKILAVARSAEPKLRALVAAAVRNSSRS